jgi:ABC-type Zn uptake system ZnuABC Zn-binding protein ZnuA
MIYTKTFLFLLVAAWCAVLAAAPAQAGDRLQVVTTTSDLASIARCVGGDRVDVLSIATGKEDSHHISAKPSYMMAVRKADLWIRTGMELEIGYESLILDGSRNARIRIGTRGHLDASVGVLRLEVPTQKIDRSMGDIHPQGNPHYLLDPLNGRIVAKSIAARLALLAPEHRAYFSERLDEFRRELDERMFGGELVAEIGGGKLWALLLKGRLDEALEDSQGCLGGWLGAMRPHAGKKLITFHRNWSYFVNRFGVVATMEVEPKPGIPPSPGRLTEVIGHVEGEGIEILLMATYFSKKAPELIAAQTGITVVDCPMFPGALPEATDYFTLFDCLVERVTGAFADSEKTAVQAAGE